MFATGKRAREEDEYECGQSPISGNKKLRTLPFRTSPTTKHTSLFSSSRHVPKPPALTPAESSEDDSDIEFTSPRYPPRQKAKPTVPSFFTTDEDMDLDMNDSQPFSSPMWSPKTPASAAMAVSATLASPAYPSLLTAGPSSVAPNARIPTPIYGHFSSLHNPMQETSSPTAARPSVVGVSRSSIAEQHDAFLRRRRLPSPISEDENMNSPTTITKGMFKDLDVSATPSSATFPDNDMMTPESPEFGARKGSTSSGGSQGSRRRSDAISGGGEGPSKVVFSMGFRADCDKCRERVPGHYSHVLKV